MRFVLFVGTFLVSFDLLAQTFNTVTDRPEWIKTEKAIRRWIATDSLDIDLRYPMDVLYVNPEQSTFRVDSASTYLHRSYRQSRPMPMDGNLNFRFYMDQHNTAIYNKNQWTVNPYFNVFNWARFVRETKSNKKRP